MKVKLLKTSYYDEYIVPTKKKLGMYNDEVWEFFRLNSHHEVQYVTKSLNCYFDKKIIELDEVDDNETPHKFIKGIFMRLKIVE